MKKSTKAERVNQTGQAAIQNRAHIPPSVWAAMNTLLVDQAGRHYLGDSDRNGVFFDADDNAIKLEDLTPEVLNQVSLGDACEWAATTYAYANDSEGWPESLLRRAVYNMKMMAVELE